jgi:hypothetical protein
MRSKTDSEATQALKCDHAPHSSLATLVRNPPRINFPARSPCLSFGAASVASLCTVPSRTTRAIWDSDNLVLPSLECFSSATNLFGLLRLFEVVVE